jgi:hypothetical protein
VCVCVCVCVDAAESVDEAGEEGQDLMAYLMPIVDDVGENSCESGDELDHAERTSGGVLVPLYELLRLS